MRTPITNSVAESLHGHYSRGKSSGVGRFARRIVRSPRDNLWGATQLYGWLVQFLNDRVALTRRFQRATNRPRFFSWRETLQIRGSLGFARGERESLSQRAVNRRHHFWRWFYSDKKRWKIRWTLIELHNCTTCWRRVIIPIYVRNDESATMFYSNSFFSNYSKIDGLVNRSMPREERERIGIRINNERWTIELLSRADKCTAKNPG